MSQQHHGPLSGITVLELGHIVAGPTASLILAELGATVIKIERPGSGDQARLNKGNQGHFISYNSNKLSIALDIQTEDGKATFLRLIDTADVLIDNFSPGALDRLGLGYDVLSVRNPRLVHGSIKGFLPGPYGHRALTDEPAQMMGGLAYMTGPKGRPLRAGTSVVDITGAMFAAIGVLAALYERRDSEKGRNIGIGLFESVVFLVGQHVAKSTLRNEVPLPMPERSMGRDLGWGIYRIFSTSDARDIFVAVLSDGHWKKFCEEFDLSELWEDPALRTANGRAEQHVRLGEATEKIIGSMIFSEAIERLERAGLPFAPVNTPYDLVTDPHLRTIGFLQEVCTPDGQKGLIARLPISSDGWFQAKRTDPPALGRDTAKVIHGTEDCAT
jgi:crotonobetainyl-CoA:carnitine CoA-transferase CaiB-like acyl-CoA transferase